MSQEKDNLYVWKINGLNLELDMEDADVMEKYNQAFDKMEKTEKNLINIGEKGNFIRKYCQMFYDLYDDLFGAGTGNKIFNGKKNARICDEVYSSFLEFVSLQTKESIQRRSEFISKYKPNRQKRRSGNKSGKRNKNYSGPHAL